MIVPRLGSGPTQCHEKKGIEMVCRLILFDLDGTLVNTGGAGLRAFDRAMAIEFDPAMNLKVLSPAGMTDPAIFREIFLRDQGRLPTEDEENRLFHRYLEYLDEEVKNSEGFRVLPGVRELLDALAGKDEVLLGLGTGNLEKGAQIKLERPGLDHYFRFGGYGSDSADRPGLLAKAVERGTALAGGGTEVDAVFVVGDTPRDVAAGKAIGALTLAVASGPHESDELATTGADLVVADLTDRPKLVKWLVS